MHRENIFYGEFMIIEYDRKVLTGADLSFEYGSNFTSVGSAISLPICLKHIEQSTSAFLNGGLLKFSPL